MCYGTSIRTSMSRALCLYHASSALSISHLPRSPSPGRLVQASPTLCTQGSTELFEVTVELVTRSDVTKVKTSRAEGPEPPSPFLSRHRTDSQTQTENTHHGILNRQPYTHDPNHSKRFGMDACSPRPPLKRRPKGTEHVLRKNHDSTIRCRSLS